METVPFEFRYHNALEFKNIVEAIRELNEEPDLEVTTEGLKLLTMDYSHITMIDLNIPSNRFEEYYIEKDTKICIDIEKVSTILKRAEKKDQLIVKRTRENKLGVSLRGEFNQYFEIYELESTFEEIPKPNIYFDSRVKVVSKALLKAIKKLNFPHITEVQLETLGNRCNQFKLSVEEGIKGEVLFEEDGNVLEIDFTRPSRSKYGIDYLLDNLQNLIKLSAIVDLEFSSDMPIRITPEANYLLEFYLAPRVGG